MVYNRFKSPLRENWIDYKRFCQIIEESFYQPCLERAPLVVPLQHFPSRDGRLNFLNFKDRNILSNAMQTLTRYADLISNLSSLFSVKCFFFVNQFDNHYYCVQILYIYRITTKSIVEQ